YASAGIGSVAHLTFEVFRDGAGIEAIHIPYKGGGAAIADILGGQVEMHMASIQVAAGLAKSGKLKALAVTSKKRSPALPDVPTLAEAGVKTADVDLSFWYAIFGPKGMPADVKAKLAKAVEKVMSDPKVRERLAKLDIEPSYAPGDVLEKKLQSEIANWTKFIDAKGIKAERSSPSPGGAWRGRVARRRAATSSGVGCWDAPPPHPGSLRSPTLPLQGRVIAPNWRNS